MSALAPGMPIASAFFMTYFFFVSIKMYRDHAVLSRARRGSKRREQQAEIYLQNDLLALHNHIKAGDDYVKRAKALNYYAPPPPVPKPAPAPKPVEPVEEAKPEVPAEPPAPRKSFFSFW